MALPQEQQVLLDAIARMIKQFAQTYQTEVTVSLDIYGDPHTSAYYRDGEFKHNRDVDDPDYGLDEDDDGA